MCFRQWFGSGSHSGTVVLVVTLLFVAGREVSASGPLPSAARASEGSAQTPAAPTAPVRRISIDDAVAMALQENLGIRAERLNPEIQAFRVVSTRAAFTPELFTRFTKNSDASPPESFLSGAAETITNSSFANATGVQQLLPWGGSYNVQWSASRLETTGFTSFNPRLRSRLDASYTQPLVRNFRIDFTRYQARTAVNLREIADVQLRQTIVATTRDVRTAYWDLVYAIANLQVAQQSLELARESLRNNRTRVEVGTMAPIDILEAEAEVARNEEAVIVAEAQIRTAEDRLRALVMNPDTPDFWRVRLEPTDTPGVRTQPIDVEGAVQNALDRRADLAAAKRQLENAELGVMLYENERLPNVDLTASYGLVGLGGTQLVFGVGGFPPPIVGSADRSFGSVLGDVLRNEYASWSLGLAIGYPIGTSQAEANLASARLERDQGETNLRNLQLQIATAVRDAGRQVDTNLKRVEATQKARELAERRLEAEQKKFTVGLSTSFVVFQVQRDLAVARNSELRAIIDYNKSLVDFEAIQEAPPGGR